MIKDINKLVKIDDILNSEGSILGLYQIENKLYLGSFLKNGLGVVYYLTEKKVLKMYFDSLVNLKSVYLISEDFIVSTKFRKETLSYIKDDLSGLIQCSEFLYSEVSDSIKNKEILKLIEHW